MLVYIVNTHVDYMQQIVTILKIELECVKLELNSSDRSLQSFSTSSAPAREGIKTCFLTLRKGRWTIQRSKFIPSIEQSNANFTLVMLPHEPDLNF